MDNQIEWREDLEECATDAVGAVEDSFEDFHRYLSNEEKNEVLRRIIASLQEELEQG